MTGKNVISCWLVHMGCDVMCRNPVYGVNRTKEWLHVLRRMSRKRWKRNRTWTSQGETSSENHLPGSVIETHRVGDGSKELHILPHRPSLFWHDHQFFFWSDCTCAFFIHLALLTFSQAEAGGEGTPLWTDDQRGLSRFWNAVFFLFFQIIMDLWSVVSCFVLF